MTDLTVDPKRENIVYTGIYVRAKYKDRWGNFDISALDAPSLLAWLRSRGGNNPWAENTVGLLLRHEQPLTGDGDVGK